MIFYLGGSETAINSRAVSAVIATHLAASSGGLTWMLVDMIYHRKRQMSLNCFCTGAVSGLVAITPAAGYVPLWSSFLFGVFR